MRNPFFPIAVSHDRSRGPESGSALVEFTLILPVLVLLLLGVADFGLALQQAMVAADAAHTGTLYATIAGNSSNTNGMKDAALAAGGSQLVVDASQNVYTCSTSVPPTTTMPSCSSGSVLKYAHVKTQITLPALFGYPGLPASFTLSGSSTIRVQ